MDARPPVRNESAGAWASLMLRLLMASLFFAAVVPKWMHGWGGIRGLVGHFATAFEKAWLPAPLVQGMAWVTPFAEALIVIWLVVGYKLTAGWIFTTAFMISLAFGMMVAGKADVASSNYLYAVIACFGLYMSKYDRYSADGLRRK